MSGQAGRPAPGPIRELLEAEDIPIVNLGLERFAETLEGEGVEVLHVDWRPPAGGDDELAAMLDVLGTGS